MKNEIDYNQLLNIAADLAYELLRNGAETYRVEESARLLIFEYRAGAAEVFAIANSVILSITLDDGTTITKQKRVLSRTVDLNKVDKLNSLCRLVCKQTPPLAQVQKELDSIRCEQGYAAPMRVLASVLVACSFTAFFGGTLRESICSAVIGVLLQLAVCALEGIEAHSVFISIAGGAVIMLSAQVLVHMGFADNVDEMVIGTLMNLVPGVALTVSMRDFIAGDYFSGQVRLSEALLTATAIALGAGAVLMLF